jgi:hypothetical protein
MDLSDLPQILVSQVTGAGQLASCPPNLQTVDFPLLKKMISAIMIFKSSEKSKLVY